MYLHCHGYNWHDKFLFLWNFIVHTSYSSLLSQYLDGPGKVAAVPDEEELERQRVKALERKKAVVDFTRAVNSLAMTAR